MGDGVGPLNEALESVTTERVGVLSQTHTDPSQFLNFFRFSTCYEVVPLIITSSAGTSTASHFHSAAHQIQDTLRNRQRLPLTFHYCLVLNPT